MNPFWGAWYAGKNFSNDWLTTRLETWLNVLAPRTAEAVTVLEVGSWEGRSAIAFLEILPSATITCIDTFGGSPNHWNDPAMEASLAALEGRFDRNLAAYSGRVRKIRDRSAAALDRLAQSGFQYDVIYIDGSHRRDDVLADTILAWRLLRIGGTLIWDDLHFKPDWPSEERPADAIALFAAMFGDCFTELHRDRQLIVEKHSAWPQRFLTIV